MYVQLSCYLFCKQHLLCIVYGITVHIFSGRPKHRPSVGQAGTGLETASPVGIACLSSIIQRAAIGRVYSQITGTMISILCQKEADVDHWSFGQGTMGRRVCGS